MRLSFFFFNDTATTEIYTLSLHDALPISDARIVIHHQDLVGAVGRSGHVHPRSVICNSRHCYQLARSEEHTSELQSRLHLVCRLLLETKKTASSGTLTKVRTSTLDYAAPA